MIRNNIRVLRAAHHLTQEELAERVGATRQTILAIENSKYSPSLKLAFEIAGVFKIGVEKVFYLDRGKGDQDER